jgi:hypothetical protein
VLAQPQPSQQYRGISRDAPSDKVPAGIDFQPPHQRALTVRSQSYTDGLIISHARHLAPFAGGPPLLAVQQIPQRTTDF